MLCGGWFGLVVQLAGESARMVEIVGGGSVLYGISIYIYIYQIFSSQMSILYKSISTHFTLHSLRHVRRSGHKVMPV